VAANSEVRAAYLGARVEAPKQAMTGAAK